MADELMLLCSGFCWYFSRGVSSPLFLNDLSCFITPPPPFFQSLLIPPVKLFLYWNPWTSQRLLLHYWYSSKTHIIEQGLLSGKKRDIIKLSFSLKIVKKIRHVPSLLLTDHPPFLFASSLIFIENYIHTHTHTLLLMLRTLSSFLN